MMLMDLHTASQVRELAESVRRQFSSVPAFRQQLLDEFSKVGIPGGFVVVYFGDGNVGLDNVRAVVQPESRHQPISDPPNRPIWDIERRELRVRGLIARTVQNVNKAKNVVGILDAFEAHGWPLRIDIPGELNLTGQLLNKAVSSLNSDLKLIRFSADGTGKGVLWRWLNRENSCLAAK
jgi:hypothetical protein